MIGEDQDAASSKFCFHLTPRQLLDGSTGDQCEQCVCDCGELKIPVWNRLYFEEKMEWATSAASPLDRAKAMVMHFKVIEQFAVVSEEEEGRGLAGAGGGLSPGKELVDVWSYDDVTEELGGLC